MAKTAEKKETKKSDKKPKILLIVESPAKAKTIKKILGDNYEIKASYGHIRDFPKKVLGFDIKDFTPTFEVISEKKKVVKELNDSAKKADIIYLAPDPDREGEAIAWHISEVLNTKGKDVKRVVFNEITKNAIKDAVASPRMIDMDKVKAQQTRQILDRLVGYKLSPLLWEKLRNYKLSAGRVQSVAVKLICDREEEILAFIPQEYWTISGDFSSDKAKKDFKAELIKYKDKKIEIKNEEDSQKIVKALEQNKEFDVSKVTKRQINKKPQPPFITSTLQRDIYNKLGYPVAKVMQIAQKLYEGIELGDDTPIGLITYMRTDSTRVSDEAVEAAKNFITDTYGENYYPKEAQNYTSKKTKNVQDAHEAIRPTYIDKTPESIKKYLSADQYKVYKIIWERFISSQMANALINSTNVELSADDYTFKLTGSVIAFEGYMKVYSSSEEESEESKIIPEFKEGDKASLKKIDPKQHFTQPPPRYTEASLVKTLEEYGIGRPSTYAPIISKIQQRGYVVKNDRALSPTPLGKTVNEQLVSHFSNIINFKFTADMEAKLDDIADQKVEWKDVLENFYEPFIETLDEARKNMGQVQILSDKVCPNCGKPMVVRTSRWKTQFLGCSGYPECKTMMPLSGENKVTVEDKPSDEKCEKCGSPMVIKQGPYGEYLGCTNEECKHKKKIIVKTGVKCPKCKKGDIIQRKSRYGKIFYGCSEYPTCDFALWNEPIDEKCPECGSILTKKFTKRFGNNIVCSNKDCGYKRPMDEE